PRHLPHARPRRRRARPPAAAARIRRGLRRDGAHLAQKRPPPPDRGPGRHLDHVPVGRDPGGPRPGADPRPARGVRKTSARQLTARFTITLISASTSGVTEAGAKATGRSL